MFSAQHVNCSMVRIVDLESSESFEYACSQGSLIVWDEEAGDLKVFTSIPSYLEEDISHIDGKSFSSIRISHQEENGMSYFSHKKVSVCVKDDVLTLELSPCSDKEDKSDKKEFPTTSQRTNTLEYVGS